MIRPLFLCLMLLPICVGCAGFRPIHGMPARYLAPELRGQSRSGKTTIDLSLLRQTPPDEYLVDAGDVLGLYIEGVLGKRDEVPPVHFPVDKEVPPSLGYPIPVRGDGTLSLPLIDPIDVSGLTVREVEEIIRKAYTQDHQILQAGRDRILVSLQKPRSYQILVLRQETGNDTTVLQGGGGGQVNLGNLKRGFGKLVRLPAYKNDVLHALADTGGLPGLDAENTIYIIRRKKKPRANRRRNSDDRPGTPHLPRLNLAPRLPNNQHQVPVPPIPALPQRPGTSSPFPVAPPSAIPPRVPRPGIIQPQQQYKFPNPPVINQTAGQNWGHTVFASAQQPNIAPNASSRYTRQPGIQTVQHQSGYPGPNAVPQTPMSPSGSGRYPGLASPSAPMPRQSSGPQNYQPTVGPNFPQGYAGPPETGQRPMRIVDPTVQNPRVIKIPVRLGPGDIVQFTEEDIILEDGDIVFIESRETEIFYTSGLLGGGQYSIPRDYDLDIVGAISIAQSQGGSGSAPRSIGGVSAMNQDVTISASDVIVLRRLPNGTQIPIKIDLYKAIRNPAERVMIQPGDHIILQYTKTEAFAAFIERHLLEGALFGVAAAQFSTNGR